MMEAWLLQIWSLRTQVVQTALEAENPSQMATPLQSTLPLQCWELLFYRHNKLLKIIAMAQINTSSCSANVKQNYQTGQPLLTAVKGRQRHGARLFLQIAPEQVISHTFLVPVVPTTLPWITNSSDNSFHSWSVLVFIVFSYPSFWAALKRKDLSRFSEAWSKALTSGLLLTACSGRLFCVLCFRRDWFRTTAMVMVLWCLISLQDVCMLGNLISCGNEWRGAILNSVGTPIFLYYFIILKWPLY